MRIRSIIRDGLLFGLVSVWLILLGLNGLMGTIVAGWIGQSSPELGSWLLLVLVSFWLGGRALTYVEKPDRRNVTIAGLAIGASNGFLVALLVAIVSILSEQGAEIRKWLVQLTDESIDLVRIGSSPVGAAIFMLLILSISGAIGALFTFTSRERDWKGTINDRFIRAQESAKNNRLTARLATDQRTRKWAYALVFIILFFAPFLMGQYWNFTLGTVGIYVILGLGLNIVVGIAGLLDLGYVAFFAIGAYTVAILTAPQPHGIGMSFWMVLPIGTFLAAISGVLLGIPVLRMRGDYLAIVTLGFGEIIRILSKSDVLTGFTGGPRGIRAVGGPEIFGLDLSSELYFMYFIIAGIVLAIFVTQRLQHSRIGRAWMAMREDQDVAEAMGVHIFKYKLLAFAIGASFAGFSGVLFASRNKFTGPEDFVLLVSINVLCLVIIGGMGSIPGVIVGALVLKGLPEMLRQLSDYRMLAFGALLVITMIVRPEGLWPPARRRMEHGHKERPNLGIEGLANPKEQQQ